MTPYNPTVSCINSNIFQDFHYCIHKNLLGFKFSIALGECSWNLFFWTEKPISRLQAAPTLEQTFVKPVNVGRKPGNQLRMRQQSEPSVMFDRIMSAPTTSPTLVASVANLSPSPSILTPASTETTTISLSSLVTSTLASAKQQPIHSFWRSLSGPGNYFWTSFEEWVT